MIRQYSISAQIELTYRRFFTFWDYPEMIALTGEFPINNNKTRR